MAATMGIQFALFIEPGSDLDLGDQIKQIASSSGAEGAPSAHRIARLIAGSVYGHCPLNHDYRTNCGTWPHGPVIQPYGLARRSITATTYTL